MKLERQKQKTKFNLKDGKIPLGTKICALMNDNGKVELIKGKIIRNDTIHMLTRYTLYDIELEKKDERGKNILFENVPESFFGKQNVAELFYETMILGNFEYKRVPTGRIGSLGTEILEYHLKYEEFEKYCVYGSKYYFIQCPLKRNGVYRIIEGYVYYDHTTFTLGVHGRYVKNNRYAASWAQDIVPYCGDKISLEFFNINLPTTYKIAIFETLDEAKDICNLFNKKLKEKRKNDENQKDLQEYERLKKKLGL